MLTQEACTRDGVSDDVRMRAVSVIMHASSADEARVLLVKAKIAEEALQVLLWRQYLYFCTSKQVLLFQYA